MATKNDVLTARRKKRQQEKDELTLESKHGSLHCRIVSPTQGEGISVLVELPLKGLDTVMAVSDKRKKRKDEKKR